MSSEIWVALIGSIGTFLGVVITVIYGNKKNEKNNKQTADLTLYRIGQLEHKVELHNNAVERLFKVEGQVREIEHDIKELKHRKEN